MAQCGTAKAQMAKKATPPAPAPVSELLLQFMDINSDGQLDAIEYKAAETKYATIRKAKMAKRKAAMMAMIDTNKDGKVSPEEKKAAMAKMRGKASKPCPMQPRKAAKPTPKPQHPVLAQFDFDKSGKLDDAEKAALEAFMKVAMQKRMEKRFDTNKDGKLDAKERATMDAKLAEMKKMKAEHQKKVAAHKAAMLAKYDTNKDGKIDREEAMSARMTEPNGSPRTPLDQLDTNKDGKLDKQEFAAALAKASAPRKRGAARGQSRRGHHGEMRGRGKGPQSFVIISGPQPVKADRRARGPQPPKAGKPGRRQGKPAGCPKCGKAPKAGKQCGMPQPRQAAIRRQPDGRQMQVRVIHVKPNKSIVVKPAKLVPASRMPKPAPAPKPAVKAIKLVPATQCTAPAPKPAPAPAPAPKPAPAPAPQA